MNESTLLKLKVIVERAVRPVEATTYRKRKMREELLAHVTGVLEDELPRCADVTTALIQVEKRFGNPSELSQKLQQSVPRNDRFGYLYERWIGPRPEESPVQFAGRLGMLMFVGSAIIGFAFAILAFPLILAAGESIEHVVVAFSPVCVSMGVMTFLANLLTNELEQPLSSKMGWPLLRQILLSVGYYVFVPALIPFVLFVTLSHTLPGNRIHFWGLLPMTIVTTCVAQSSILTAMMIADGKRYREEWSKLQID